MPDRGQSEAGALARHAEGCPATTTAVRAPSLIGSPLLDVRCAEWLAPLRTVGIRLPARSLGGSGANLEE